MGKANYRYDRFDWAVAIGGFIFLVVAVPILAIGLRGGSVDGINLWYCLGISITLSIIRECCKWSTLTEMLNES